MELYQPRIFSTPQATIGCMFVDGRSFGYTLEDELRAVKVPGETRIPAGEYKLILRGFGGHFERYTRKFPWHREMIQIEDVPGFTDILYHIGNYEWDTDGCVLIGSHANLETMSIQASTTAYKGWYEEVYSAVARGDARAKIEDLWRRI